MYKNLRPCFFNYSGYILKSRIAVSHGNSMVTFLRNWQTVFHSNYTSLHAHRQHTTVPLSPYPCRHLLFVVVVLFCCVLLVVITIVIGFVVLIRISLVILNIFSCVYWPFVYRFLKELLKKDFTYLFLERGEGREKKMERNINVWEKHWSVASCMTTT